MRTQAQRIGGKFTTRNMRALWVALENFAVHGDCRAGAWQALGWRAPMIAPPLARREEFAARFVGGGYHAGAATERHLLLALRSVEQRRGAWWETAGFVAIWLSGLIGVALCLL